MRTSQVLPWSFRRVAISVESEALLAEEETIGMGLGELEPIIVPALAGSHFDFGLYARGNAAAAEELVVGPSIFLDEFGQSPGAKHPAHHLEEVDEVGFARAVRADEDGGLGYIVHLDVRQRSEPANVHGFNRCSAHRLLILPQIIVHPNDYTLPTPVVIHA